MSRIASLFVAACSAALIGGSALAQAPAPAAASPPPAPPAYGEPINLETAKKAVAAAMAEAKKNNWFMAISVVSPSGDLVLFEKMDNTQYASIAISQHKAKAATTFRRPTKVFQDMLAASTANIYVLTLDGSIASEGGVPILVGGKIVGAIGCSGGTGPQDGQVCRAGADTVK